MHGRWVVELLLDDSGLACAFEAAGVARERYTPTMVPAVQSVFDQSGNAG